MKWQNLKLTRKKRRKNWKMMWILVKFQVFINMILNKGKNLITLFLVKKKRMAMLDTLIAAQKDGEKIDDEGIREEVDTFIFEVNQ